MNGIKEQQILAIEDIATVKIDRSNNNRSLIAKKDFYPNEIISAFWWEIVYDKPNYLTVQIGNQEHIILEPACLECINHSCTPNSFFDTEKKLLICISPIKTGEEFTFFYPSAEWEMEQTFDCHCKKLNCIGRVKGAKFLDKKILEKYRLTSLIAQKLLEKKI